MEMIVRRVLVIAILVGAAYFAGRHGGEPAGSGAEPARLRHDPARAEQRGEGPAARLEKDVDGKPAAETGKPKKTDKPATAEADAQDPANRPSEEAPDWAEPGVVPVVKDLPRQALTEDTPLPPEMNRGFAPIDYALSEPRAGKNLAVFFFNKADIRVDYGLLILGEALARDLLVAHEIGETDKLVVENVSDKESVLVQSGDVFKSGKADRIAAFDVVLPPKSGRVPIRVFSVEHGRWAVRGNEPEDLFGASTSTANLPPLLNAVRAERDQKTVWSAVTGLQEKLTLNAGLDTNKLASGSSLQLTLESDAVEKAIRPYLKAFEDAPPADAIGMAYYVNGVFQAADFYGDERLFAKFWPRLIRAAAVEAVAAGMKEILKPPPTEALRKLLKNAEKGAARYLDLPPLTRWVTFESADVFLYETRDPELLDAVIHRSYVRKTERPR